jgi:hypothetical protein
LVEKGVPGIATVIDDVVEGFEDAVRQPVLPHELPYVFLAAARRLQPQPFSILLAQRFIALVSKPLNNITVHCCLDLALLLPAPGRQLWRTPIVNSLPRNAALAHGLPDPGNDGTQGLTL